MSPALRSRLVLGLGIVGVRSLGTVTPVLGVVGVLLAIAVLIYQHRTARPAVWPFTPTDWKREGEGHALAIQARKHGKRDPSVTVWAPTPDGGHQEVICGIETSAQGDVRISITSAPFTGEARIS